MPTFSPKRIVKLKTNKLAAHLETTHGTLVCRGTPVEKHCSSYMFIEKAAETTFIQKNCNMLMKLTPVCLYNENFFISLSQEISPEVQRCTPALTIVVTSFHFRDIRDGKLKRHRPRRNLPTNRNPVVGKQFHPLKAIQCPTIQPIRILMWVLTDDYTHFLFHQLVNDADV